MHTIAALPIPDLGTLRVATSGPASLTLSGAMTATDPRKLFGPFLRSVHEIACNLPERRLEVDVTRLTFINSSAIRVLLDWAMWVMEEPLERRYALHLRTDPTISWQQASLPTLAALAPEVVELESMA